MVLRIAGIAPHPAIIIPAVGRGVQTQAQKTIAGMEKLSRRFSEAQPELLVVITPHGLNLRDGVAVIGEPEPAGNLGQFGAPQVRLSMRTDYQLLRLLEHETAGTAAETVVLESPPPLDHGAMVPLYYLREAGLEPVTGLHVTFGFLPASALFAYGQALRRAIEKRGIPTALLASADLSHRLKPGAPAGFSPRAAEFDRLLVELLKQGRVQEILAMDPVLVEEAAECGLRSIIIALGALEGEPYTIEVFSYEGPFGVGYLVAELLPAASAAGKGGDGAVEASASRGKLRGGPARLARQALEHLLHHGCDLKQPDPLPPGLEGRAGVFVTLKKEGQLRGCIGTVEPERRNIAEEIIANTAAAALRDPRFSPVHRDELAQLTVSVDILTPMERIKSIKELDPRVYGVLVRGGGRSGLLLPDLEGIDTAAQQVDIARRKAGLFPGEPLELYRFRVIRYT